LRCEWKGADSYERPAAPCAILRSTHSRGVLRRHRNAYRLRICLACAGHTPGRPRLVGPGRPRSTRSFRTFARHWKPRGADPRRGPSAVAVDPCPGVFRAGRTAREVRPHVTVRRARDVVLDRAVALTTPVSSAGTCSPRTYCSGPTRAGRRGPVAAGDDAVRRRRGARCAGVRRSPQRRRPRRRASADASGRSRRRCRSRTGRAFPARKRCTGCLPRWWRVGHLDADLKGKVTRVYPYEG
jgi:hypothetical protein